MSVQTVEMLPVEKMPVEKPRRVWGGDVLACGFGMTVAVWIVAYVSRLPLVNAPGAVSVCSMVGMVVLGGFLTARYSKWGVGAAVLAGGLSGLLDILIIGSLIHDYMAAHQEAELPSAMMWFGGSVGLNMIAAGLGGMVGNFFPSKTRGEIMWGAVFAFVLSAAILPLITIGGLVTAFHAGLAVPDWPQSYGYNMFLFPLSMMQKNDGNFYEHSHRLMGALVGVTCLALAIYQSVAVRPGKSWRWWLIILPWLIGCGLGFQAWLGGTRVVDKSIFRAMAHGVFAQVLFAATAVQVVVNTRAFAKAVREKTHAASTDRTFTASLIGILIVQLALGVMLRQKDAMLMVHITVAVGVLVTALASGVRAWGLHGSHGALRKAGIAVICVVCLQVVLGIIAVWVRSGPEGEPTAAGALLTTAHQANGALLLATSAVLLTWTWRILAPVKK